MVKIFYHNDPDGWCSAYWVRKHLEQEGIPFTRKDFIEMNYDQPWPEHIVGDTITNNEKVFIVDFSFDVEEFDHRFLTSDVTWIDHHKTAIEKYNGYPVKIKGLRVDGVAACALTWAYLFGKKDDETFIEDVPLFTQYIHLWDTWQWKNHSDNEEIEEFITSIMAHSSFNDPLSVYWDTLNDNPDAVVDMCNHGMAMIDFRNGYGKTCCDSIGKVIEFEGYRCFVCNMPKCNSEWFKSVDPSTYDILMPFYYNIQTGLFLFSLYCSSPDIDVSKIAVKYGGGGHRGASGFQCTTLPFQ